MKVRIITDSACDLPIEYIEENQIDVAPLMVNINGKFIPDDLGQSLKHEDFYKMIKEGAMPSTTQVNVGTFLELFKKYVKQGETILYIGLSSALSGTYNSSNTAREMILEEYPDAKIYLIDSLSASVGEGLLVYKANEMLNNNIDIDEVVKFIENIKRHVIHAITVDDLNHLKRGGRVSSTAAIVGTMLNIKPILHVDDEGRLIPVSKVKGRKKSIKGLQESLKERIIKPEEQTIFISHGDCLSEAEHLKDLILNEVQVKEVIINNVGPAVGSHSGPGTIALFFIGENR